MLLKNIHLHRIYWAITSPSLMAFPVSVDYIRSPEHLNSVIRILTDLDSNPVQMNQYFDALGNLPMGKYFEQLIFFMIEQDERFELILSNQQIKEGNITIGEIDLIVKDCVTNKIEHWEICLKYYLQSVPSPEPSLMIGPGAKDNLARKTDKLLNHQLPLAKHSSLTNVNKRHTIDSKLFMKGQFFYHLNNNKVLPEHSNPTHESGWWCFLSEIDDVIRGSIKWTTLSKPEWIGQHQHFNDADLLSDEQLKGSLNAHFEADNQSVLAVGLKPTKEGWIEQTRGFIVNDNWPLLIPQWG